MSLDHIDVVARGIQQDVTPVVSNRPDVRPPIDETGTQVEVRLQQVVLAVTNRDGRMPSATKLSDPVVRHTYHLLVIEVHPRPCTWHHD